MAASFNYNLLSNHASTTHPGHPRHHAVCENLARVWKHCGVHHFKTSGLVYDQQRCVPSTCLLLRGSDRNSKQRSSKDQELKPLAMSSSSLPSPDTDDTSDSNATDTTALDKGDHPSLKPPAHSPARPLAIMLLLTTILMGLLRLGIFAIEATQSGALLGVVGIARLLTPESGTEAFNPNPTPDLSDAPEFSGGSDTSDAPVTGTVAAAVARQASSWLIPNLNALTQSPSDPGHVMVLTLLRVQSWLLDVWTAALGGQGILSRFQVWYEDSALGLTLQLHLHMAVAYWLLYSKEDCRRQILGAAKAIIVHVCKLCAWAGGGAPVLDEAGSKQPPSSPSFHRQDQTGQGPTSCAHQEALLAHDCKADSKSTTSHGAQSPSLATDTALRASLGLCSCVAMTSSIASTSAMPAPLVLASHFLTFVQVAAAAVYLCQAVQPTKMGEFFSQHRGALLAQVFTLLAARSVVEAAVTQEAVRQVLYATPLGALEAVILPARPLLLGLLYGLSLRAPPQVLHSGMVSVLLFMMFVPLAMWAVISPV